MIVSGFCLSTCWLTVKRSTKGTPLAAATSTIALVYSSRRRLVSLPSGRFGLLDSSKAMGEMRARRGALLPLYFCERACLMKSSRSALNFGRPAAPANDSL